MGRAGVAYEKHIAEQLTEQRARKASLEQRGTAIITTSGVIVTLLFGFGGLISSRSDARLDLVPQLLLAGAVVAFVFALVLGLVVSHPAAYRESETEWMRSLTDASNWIRSDVEGERLVAQSRVAIIEVARAANKTKAKLLLWAYAAEVAAVGLLGSAVMVLVLTI